MKSIVRIAMAVLIAASFASCIKTVDAPQTPASNLLTGSWVINNAAENDGNGWYVFNPGVSGVFSFYNNGTAQYDDGYALMQGNWYSDVQSTGYYDEYGNYYTNAHQTLQVQTSSNGGGSLNLYFDDISFADRDQFVATYYNGKGIEKYVFIRY